MKNLHYHFNRRADLETRSGGGFQEFRHLQSDSFWESSSDF
jgi:hypothetical protein